jgi:hypothetical protein
MRSIHAEDTGFCSLRTGMLLAGAILTARLAASALGQGLNWFNNLDYQ